MSSEAPHVIMADDEPDILELLAHLLNRHGYSVESTTDGEQVLELINQKRPDVILLDVHMGDTDGSELCKKLKRTDASKNIPVVMVSSDSNLEQIARICSADGYISKPVEIKDLLDLMQKVRSAR